MLLTACLFCWGCQGVPAWPESGIANADWVETAIAWRLQTGLDALLKGSADSPDKVAEESLYVTD